MRVKNERHVAQLWLRADRPDDARPHLFDNMNGSPISSSEWQRHEIVGVVDDDAEKLNIGLMVFGAATAWIDDVRFEIVE